MKELLPRAQSIGLDVRIEKSASICEFHICKRSAKSSNLTMGKLVSI